MEVGIAMSDPIEHLEVLSNNPFIFASSILRFYEALGIKRHSLLFAYLLLPISLQEERRKFLIRSTVRSSLRTMLANKRIFNGLAELVEDYKSITNTTLQYLISAGAIAIVDDEVIVTGGLVGHDVPAPKGLEKATTALAGFFKPYEVPMVYRMVGVFTL